MLKVLWAHNYLTLCSEVCASNAAVFFLSWDKHKYILTCFLGQIILLSRRLINTLEAYNLSQSHWVVESIPWWVFFIPHLCLTNSYISNSVANEFWFDKAFLNDTQWYPFSMIPIRRTCFRAHVWILLAWMHNPNCWT